MTRIGALTNHKANMYKNVVRRKKKVSGGRQQDYDGILCFSSARWCPFMAFIDGYRNCLNRTFPFIGKFVDNIFKLLLNVAPHWHHVDFMPDFYIEELTFQVP